MRLREVIRKLHGCDSKHVRSAYVREMFQGKIAWDGTVEVFDLIGHPGAKKCYVWAHAKEGGGQRYVTVLEMPPIDSPTKAVQALIAAEFQRKKRGD